MKGSINFYLVNNFIEKSVLIVDSVTVINSRLFISN